MSNKDISMVQECTDSYEVRPTIDGKTEIVIRVPARFKTLWLVRLSEMRTSVDEISRYESG